MYRPPTQNGGVSRQVIIGCLLPTSRLASSLGYNYYLPKGYAVCSDRKKAHSGAYHFVTSKGILDYIQWNVSKNITQQNNSNDIFLISVKFHVDTCL